MRHRGFSRFGSSLTDALIGQLQPVLDQQVQRVTIDTTILPSVVIDHPFAVDASGSSTASGEDTSWVLKLLKPKITVNTASGPMTIAPWGEPGRHWGLVQVLAVSIVGLAALGGFDLLRRGLKGLRHG